MKHVALRKKLNSKSGFSLTEMLVTVLLMTIVLSAVTGGIEAARRAYQSVRLKADAQMLLATTITEVSAELERAKDLQVNSDQSIGEFYSERRGGYVQFENEKWGDTDKGGWRIVGIAITNLNDTGNEHPLVTMVTDDARGADTLYTQFVKTNDDSDPGVPFFKKDSVSEETDKTHTADAADDKEGSGALKIETKKEKSMDPGYIQYTIQVLNHKISGAADGSDDQVLATRTVTVRPVLCQ